MKKKEINTLYQVKRRQAFAMTLLTSSLALTGCEQVEITETVAPVIKPALIETVQTKRSNELTFNGVVQAAKRADLAFHTSGHLTIINVDEGQQVKKDDVLAELDSRDEVIALESARLEHKNLLAEYNRAKAIYKKTQAISASDLEGIQTRLNLAQNRLNDARLKLENTKIKAPFNGIIGRIFVDNHSQLQANQAVLTLHNLDDLEVLINIPHQVMGAEIHDTEANAEIVSIPGKLFPLTLRTFATQPDPVTQTYPVVLGLKGLNGMRVLPGMTVKVIPSSNSEGLQLITVPLTAVVPDNQGKQFIWVVDENNIAQRRHIDIGAMQGNRVVVTNYLNVGEKVIIAGASSITEGLEVRPYSDNPNGK